MSRIFSSRDQLYDLVRPAFVWTYVILIASRFRQVLDLLLYRSFAQVSQRDMLDSSGQELSVGLYSCKPGYAEEIECAVCLCKIDEGEEIRELRCDHLFHRVCLDRWLGCKRVTCPICRGSLLPRRTADKQGVEVLVFKYCSFSSGDRETWWIR